MNNPHTSSDILLCVDKNTECRIGIGEKYGGGGTEGMQIRYTNGKSKNVPFYSLFGPYTKGLSNVVFSEEMEFLVKSLSFSNKEILDLFYTSSHEGEIQKLGFGETMEALFGSNIEFLPEIDENGDFTSHLIEQDIAHEEGIGHISTYFWAVDPNVFREQNDIGIYFPHRTSQAFFDESFCAGSLGGGDISVNVHPYRVTTGDTSDEALSEWEMRAQSKVHPGLRKYLSVQSVLGRIRDEVGVTLEYMGKDFPKISELGKVDFRSLVPKVPKLHCIEYNLPYAALGREEKNGKTRIIDHTGRVDIYVFEHSGDIIEFDHSKIESIELLPSRVIQELLESKPELFGGNNDGLWKTTTEYKMIGKILDEIQKKFL